MFMCELEYHPLVAWLTVNKPEATIFLNWTVPIVSGIDPFISDYCVNVTDTTSNSPLYSTCGISATEFSYPLPPQSWCSIFVFTVYIANVAEEQDSRAYQGSATTPKVHKALRSVTTASGSTFTYLLIMVMQCMHAGYFCKMLHVYYYYYYRLLQCAVVNRHLLTLILEITQQEDTLN